MVDKDEAMCIFGCTGEKCDPENHREKHIQILQMGEERLKQRNEDLITEIIEKQDRREEAYNKIFAVLNHMETEGICKRADINEAIFKIARERWNG